MQESMFGPFLNVIVINSLLHSIKHECIITFVIGLEFIADIAKHNQQEAQHEVRKATT